MFATRISENTYRVKHCRHGRVAFYIVSATDGFTAINIILTYLFSIPKNQAIS